jgi:hypothetical protein
VIIEAGNFVNILCGYYQILTLGLVIDEVLSESDCFLLFIAFYKNQNTNFILYEITIIIQKQGPLSLHNLGLTFV